MSLEDKINTDIKAAMLAKETQKLEALRAIKSALLLLKTSGEAITPEAEVKALQKMVKQRRETAEIYQKQNRPDLAEVELAQAAVIEKYLPAQMSEEEIREALKKIISQLGVSSPSEMGKVMGVATKELSGKADGKTISAIVKQLLG